MDAKSFENRYFLSFLADLCQSHLLKRFGSSFSSLLESQNLDFCCPCQCFARFFDVLDFWLRTRFPFDFASEIGSEMEPNRVKIASHSQYFKH